MFGSPIGVIIGRFQVAELHKGHEELIQHVIERHKEVVVLVGDRPSPATAKNPLSFDTRARLITAAFPSVTVLRLTDQPTNEIWTEKLDTLLGLIAPYGAQLYTGRDGFKSCYSGKYPVQEVTFEKDHITATEHRRTIAENGENVFHGSFAHAFRSGQIYQMQTLHPRTYTTVDMAMVRDLGKVNGYGRFELLLCRKPTDPKNEWRLPGGFVDSGETFRQAAAREMREETGLHTEAPWDIVGDYMIDDWRVQGQDDVKHRTVLLVGHYSWGKDQAADDIEETKWFDGYDLSSQIHSLVMKDHRTLVHDVCDYMRTKYDMRTNLTFYMNYKLADTGC